MTALSRTTILAAYADRAVRRSGYRLASSIVFAAGYVFLALIVFGGYRP